MKNLYFEGHSEKPGMLLKLEEIQEIVRSFFASIVHTAPLTNLSVCVNICQPFTLLRFCTKTQIEIIVFVGSHCSQQRRKNIR